MYNTLLFVFYINRKCCMFYLSLLYIFLVSTAFCDDTPLLAREDNVEIAAVQHRAISTVESSSLGAISPSIAPLQIEPHRSEDIDSFRPPVQSRLDVFPQSQLEAQAHVNASTQRSVSSRDSERHMVMSPQYGYGAPRHPMPSRQHPKFMSEERLSGAVRSSGGTAQRSVFGGHPDDYMSAPPPYGYGGAARDMYSDHLPTSFSHRGEYGVYQAAPQQLRFSGQAHVGGDVKASDGSEVYINSQITKQIIENSKFKKEYKFMVKHVRDAIEEDGSIAEFETLFKLYEANPAMAELYEENFKVLGGGNRRERLHGNPIAREIGADITVKSTRKYLEREVALYMSSPACMLCACSAVNNALTKYEDAIEDYEYCKKFYVSQSQHVAQLEAKITTVNSYIERVKCKRCCAISFCCIPLVIVGGLVGYAFAAPASLPAI